MNCSRVLDLIDDHVDGLLPAGEAENVRDHLDDCHDCRETAIAARAASTSLASWGDHAPPPNCFDQILAKIDALPPQALQRPAQRAAVPLWRRLPLFSTRVSARWALPTLAAAAAVVAAFAIQDGRRRNVPSTFGSGPVAALASASSMRSAAARAAAASALLPGEERVHLDRDGWDSGVRRSPGTFVPPTVAARFEDVPVFLPLR